MREGKGVSQASLNQAETGPLPRGTSVEDDQATQTNFQAAHEINRNGKTASSNGYMDDWLPGKPWNQETVQARAKELLSLSKEQVFAELPSEMFLEAKGALKKRLLDVYWDLWNKILKPIAAGKKLVFFTDGDGTCFYKNPIMVESTSSQASLLDKHWHRVLAQAFYYMGVKLGLLTARPGISAGLGLVTTESGNGKGWISSEEISSPVGQKAEIPYSAKSPQDVGIAKVIDIYGLSGGITSINGEPVIISEDTEKYRKLFKFLDEKFDIVQKILAIFKNDGDPIRVTELKSVKKAYFLIPSLTLNQDIELMDLATVSRKEKWSSSRFINEVNKLNLDLPEQLRNILDPNDPDAEVKFTETLRDGEIVCVTPHFIDSRGVSRDDLRAKMYDLFFECARAPETKAWLEQEFGVPQDVDVITINNKDVSDIKRFQDIEDFPAFIKGTAKRFAPKHKYTLINVIDNNQFYVEFAPNNSKGDVIPSFIEATEKNLFPVFAGDSSSDAPACAQAVISGGLAIIVRGLINDEDVANRMVEILAKSKNAGHPDQLEDLGENQYRHLETNEIKNKDEWIKIFADKYKDQILHFDNIHINNGFLAQLFSKFCEREPGCDFKLNPKVAWAQDTIGRERTLQTPDIGLKERGIDQLFPPPKKTLVEKAKWLVSLPLVGHWIKEALKIENSRPIFHNLLKYIPFGLWGAGIAGAVGYFTDNKILTSLAKTAQGLAYGINNGASGIGRGLRATTRYPGQFWGEIVAFISNTCFGLETFAHKILMALSNGLLQMGRANQVIQAENTILDGYKKGSEEEVKNTFGQDYDQFSNIRLVGKDLTELRTKYINKLRPWMGQFFAETVADIIQATKMGVQFFSVKGFRLGSFMNMFKKSGLTKTSMTSGKDYTNVASPAHVYSATALLTYATSIIATMAHGIFENKFLNWFLTAASNILPTFGMVSAARHVEQDAHGYMRQFTDVVGRQVTFNPEKAGWWQRIGAWGMALSSLFHNTTLGQLGFNSSVGAYFTGIAEELQAVLELGAINDMRQTDTYAVDNDRNKDPKIIDFVKKQRLHNLPNQEIPLAAAA